MMENKGRGSTILYGLIIPKTCYLKFQGDIKHVEFRKTPDNNDDRMLTLMEMLVDASEKAIHLSCRILGVGKYNAPTDIQRRS